MKMQTLHYAMPKADLLSITTQLDELDWAVRAEEGEQDGDAIAYYAVSRKTGKRAKKAIFMALSHSVADAYLVRCAEGLIDVQVG